MTDLDKKAISVLNEVDSRFYLDMVDPLQIGIGETLFAEEGGALINVRGTVMWMAKTNKLATKYAEYVKKFINDGNEGGVVVHDEENIELSCDILGLRPGTPCYMAARFSKDKFDIQTDAEIKKLTHDYDELVWHTYGFIKDYDWGKFVAKESIDSGMYGAFVDGKCAGFIGTHSEGTMGMLEILPEFRRRGYGKALEEYLVNAYIDQGRIPYCHILETNSASLALQKEMGFWLSEDKRLNWLQD